MRSILKSLGIVYGDIGTSPIYTITVIFLLLEPTYDNVRGVLSLIVWTLITLVTIQYAWLATSLGKKGEGGTIVLREILVSYLKGGRKVAFISLLSFVGVSLLIGDGVITPAISILSAVEGSVLIPGFEDLSQTRIVIIAGLIAVLLFYFQKRGTEKVAWAFGPIMVIWFLSLAISGIAGLVNAPEVLLGVNPYYGIRFMTDNGLLAFFILSEVILCATGGEALYADMGHLGRAPIVKGWFLVFIMLVLNYMGQGAFLLTHPGTKNVLFEMVFNQAQVLYIPFLLLSIAATIIASQAMISAMFSIVYQGITTHVMPLFRISYTSAEMRSQIYIPFVNWFLLAAVLFVMYIFQESHKLAAAYGLAVTGTMLLTGFMMTWIFLIRKKYILVGISVLVTLIDLVYFLSNTFKIPLGGYWSIIIALLPFSLILIYTRGQKRLYKAMRPLNLEAFLIGYNQIYKALPKISGTALFFAKESKVIAPYIVHTIFKNNIIYEDNILVSLIRTEKPFGVEYQFKEDLAPGLRVFELRLGYMEVVDVESILKEAGINEKTIFYGLEEITTSNFIWMIFSVIKKLTPSFIVFYKLPANKLHGVITRVEM
ncbi:MAG: KUP/HAK/KT family potassium transporter [Deltaproteobacteria bacterium]|nr:KUP/HAK/KT family potassium transporter [Deltaproteobacteria bacterium]MBZ0219018.1 KUP/HAK/KT family potassium transporter [Deltaproteobacteria bacterium]